MMRVGSRHMAPFRSCKVADCEDAYLNASPENCALPRALLCTRPAIDSAASSRGWLPQSPRAGQRARPARRPISGRRRRAGLVAPRNLAVDPLTRAAQTHTPRPLVHPHRDSPSLHFEMTFRSAERSSRETSKTGLRPVGRAAGAALGTGLRPVRSAPAGSVATRQHARPARRPVSSCRRRAGLLATRNVAHHPLSCAAQTHPPRIGDALPCLWKPRQYLPTLYLEMAFRSGESSSRETSKTGLRPVGRAAGAAFETGLRPVRRAPTGRVAIGLHARPARRPVPSCRRRAGLVPTRTFSDPCLTTTYFPLDNTPPPARPSLHEHRRGHLSAHRRDLEIRRYFTENLASTRALFLPATLTLFHDGPPNKRLVSDRAGRCAPVPAAQPQGVRPESDCGVLACTRIRRRVPPSGPRRALSTQATRRLNLLHN
jgi:hypothetical protein